MASFTFADAAIDLAYNSLQSLENVIAKCEEAGAAEADMIPARLAEDMLPFRFQMYFATALVAKLVARLSGTEPKEFPFDDAACSTYELCKARIAEVHAIVDTADRDTINARQGETCTVGMGPGRPDAKVSAWGYLNGYSQPHILFHVVTAYDIARSKGVPLGKGDYVKHFMAKHIIA